MSIAFKLLIRFFQQKQAIIEMAGLVQLLENASDIQILKSVEKQLTEMKRIADNAEFWLGIPEQEELLQARNFMERLEMLADLCVKKALSPYNFTDNNQLATSIRRCEVARLVRRRQPNKGTLETEAVVLSDTSEML